ncbi:MAG TPA: hypothetical protein VFR51_12530 [Pyrinomonadaceae bacterium]|nr:hypothetical protein [Pyrinomonadaceae bacterium]
MRRVAPQVFAPLFCITLLLLSNSISQAQVPPQVEIQNRAWVLSNMRRVVSVDERAREKLLLQMALREDYRKLQVVNNDLMKRVFKPSGNETISGKEISSRLSEIKKLAERLRSNFGFPKEEGNEPANDLALKPGLLQLDQTIISFVDNPLLRQPRVYDTKLASEAARDLGSVSRLADALKRLVKEK